MLGVECHVGLDPLAASDWDRDSVVGVDRVRIKSKGVSNIESGVHCDWLRVVEPYRRVLSIGGPGVPRLSGSAEKIITWWDIGNFIHTAVVGDDRLPLLCGTNSITLSILVEANLRSADNLACFIVDCPIEDRLGRE